MELLSILLIGLLKLIGILILVFPIFRITALGTYEGKNIILKIYLNLYPIVVTVLLILFVLIGVVYSLGKS